MKRILCLGRSVLDIWAPNLDRLPPRYTVRQLDHISLIPGGGGTTTAAMIARLSAIQNANLPAYRDPPSHVHLLSSVGADLEGQFIMLHLESLGVTISQTTNREEQRTALQAAQMLNVGI